MKLLASETKNLLDKLYNLRGEDSTVLKKINKEREEAFNTQDRTKKEKAVLLEEIEKLTNEEAVLAKEGNLLLEVLGKIDRNNFATVLDRLKIDFDPEKLNAKVEKLLPETINAVVERKQKATEKLEAVEKEMNDAITLGEELGIRKDEALNNQSKLNDFIELALNGNISITREDITSLLEKFDFTEDEQREAAKILMFPEDSLYAYDASLKSGADKVNKTITEVLAEAKKESTVEELKEEPVDVIMEEPVITDIFEKVIKENTIDIKSNLTKEDKRSEKEKFEQALSDVGLKTSDFSDNDLAKLKEHYDVDLMKKNVQFLMDKKMELDIIKTNVELLYDKELKEKVEKLLKIGKEPEDICLVPDVLVKYNLMGLNNTINVLQISGLDPSIIPLAAY